MNCRRCGFPVGPQQGICPSCGALVENTNDLTNMQSVPNMNGLVNVPGVTNTNNVAMQGMNGFVANPNEQVVQNHTMSQGMINYQSNVSMGMYQEPSNINLASDYKPMADQSMLSSYSMNTSVMSNLVNTTSNVDMIYNQSNVVSAVQNNTNEENGMYYGDLNLPDEGGNKKRFPWFLIAGVLLVIMIVGIVFVPQINKLNVSTYVGDYYDLKYNANWKVDKDTEEMILYYSDNNSKFVFTALSSFTALNSSVESETAKKDLYNQFYSAWSKFDGGELIGGTDTFLKLTEDTLYARIDYAIAEDASVGSFYIIVSEKNDKVISFMTYCNENNKKEIDNDVMKMLESITYKKESERSAYNEFKAGDVKDYVVFGYMKYDIPSCWTFDEGRTKSVEYKSNVFKFMDDTSLLSIMAYSPGLSGTTYEAVKQSIITQYGAIKEEKSKTFNGKVWYILVTPDYESGGLSFHNEVYFTLSNNNKNLYYIMAYISNDTSEKKTKYLNESIEYIIKSAKLEKLN